MAARTKSKATTADDVEAAVAAVGRAVGDLVAMLGSPDPTAGPRVVQALLRFGPAAAVGFLADAWAEAEADPARRVGIACAIRGFGSAPEGRGPALRALTAALRLETELIPKLALAKSMRELAPTPEEMAEARPRPWAAAAGGRAGGPMPPST